MASRPRPRSAFDRPPRNEKWGTIAETNMGLGKQKVSKDDLDALVERLHGDRSRRVPDANRTGALKDAGIMNSYAWKGY